ncbi:MAG: hypothetical protein C6P37_09045 [Caldibacillus debilis]|uniref:Uncharacterized protein n=1 Tax=Caldibacillus debilis TaxID=301148 RepID=A0A3E0K4I9_9BACI|nr:MAG: hypothetical protein C6P37_09045 [Caldibacillus debilis]
MTRHVYIAILAGKIRSGHSQLMGFTPEFTKLPVAPDSSALFGFAFPGRCVPPAAFLPFSDFLPSFFPAYFLPGFPAA